MKAVIVCEHESGQGLTEVEVECAGVSVNTDGELWIVDEGDCIIREFSWNEWSAITVDKRVQS